MAAATAQVTEQLGKMTLVSEESMKQKNAAAPANAQMSDMELNGFMQLYERFVRSKGEKKAQLDWAKIQSPDDNMLKPYAELPSPSPEEEAALLNKLVVCKLNGGLGTSMGCKGPKSIIDVRSNATFLDLIVQQIETLNKENSGVDVPLVLMNSFNTADDTDKIIRKYKDAQVNVLTFNQSRYPRILTETLEPLPWTHSDYDAEDWYPPGHGDVYAALMNSGIVDKMLAEGKEYIFVSNVDNLGAVVDTKILKMMADCNSEYCMELTDKTRADIKGGTLINYEGKSSLLEVAQVPKEYVGEFKSIKKFKVFNTNNIWMSLSAIKRIMEKGMELDIIENGKEARGQKVIQLETAIGAGISYFSNACGANVPRSRFLPVKTTSDLLLIQSNLYTLNKGTLVMNPERMFSSTPAITLGPEFKKVAGYNARFGSIPDVIELDHLTVSGNVSFGKKVSLRGTVIIVCQEGSSIMIPDGAILENKVVTGSLAIMDH
ncbi:UTP--glucose-1-phosphate uridylyltransferase [Porphyridium purpureum]|uniref:UTP--glucose-1-phosphate uridylyltransferase n=1 Tax=Porphyridium purpureum TaxID=35688 RepID=A0A5J4YVD9_PORPP|nr:UTP--glucose-1-phosphate uridylyltransferase [Porphyridium purpureum]|eukprot:POR1962..scf209_3